MVILFAVYSRSQWTLPREIARRLRGIGESVDVVWFGPRGAIESEVADQAKALGCRFFAHEAHNEQVAPEELSASLLPVRSMDGVPLQNDHPYRILVRRQIAGAQAILHTSRPSILVVCEDGPGGDSALIEVARNAATPVLVVPFGIGESHDYDMFLADKAREKCLNLVPDDAIGNFLRKYGNHWIRPTAMGEALLFPAELIVARLLEGLDLPRPWAVQGGNADRIAVESRAMLKHFHREQTPPSKLALVGTVYCDVVHDALVVDEDCLRAYKSQDYIAQNRVSVLVSLPPDYHSTRASYCEFKKYEDMCQSLLDLFSELADVDVTVSLHPNSSDETRSILERHGARLTDQWVVTQIPRHDIFVTTFSSTIRWAIAAGKPVINYDIYGFGLPTYRDVPGITSATYRTLEEVGNHLRLLCTDADAYREAAWTQKRVADEWGTLDGHNFERLHALMQEMVQASTAS